MPGNYNQNLKLMIGQKIKLLKFAEQLILSGYDRVSEIDSPGQYIMLGDTLTIWPVNLDHKIRIDLFGNLVESIYCIEAPKGPLSEGAQSLKFKVQNICIQSNFLVLDGGETIKPNKYLVHIDHGIGIFKSLGMKKINDEIKQYIFIEYLNNSFLYLPIALKSKITSYIGVGRRKPKLNKLGNGTWLRTKQKAYESVIALTKELLLIYAKRELIERTPYKIDRQWDKEIKASFSFIETPDQDKALAEVYIDLAKKAPLDRLICGDVGFGKTEIAMRAVVQTMANGHQAVLLCPTTILAEQHYANFSARMKTLPVNIAKLSRFYNKKQQLEVLEGLKNGGVDFVIGTHRLLSADIAFKNLDLIIIDEEQRFGVKQKEKFKSLREKINVLTLSATPIPRTLFMALSGIRDISEINTPPAGRKNIHTHIAKNDLKIEQEYIERELLRNGQIYYLHNQVQTIEAKASQLRKEYPSATIRVAHGQMEGKRLAETMDNFASGKIDILVCSTIIENGLDLANVNTLIVEESDNFGLAQLYQIRGRIGRSARQAYCLLLHKESKLSNDAYKRLNALAENSFLGAGFNIALSDLEIRGGGNILGREQHGTMEAIGLVLYTKLLKQAVDKLKN